MAKKSGKTKAQKRTAPAQRASAAKRTRVASRGAKRRAAPVKAKAKARTARKKAAPAKAAKRKRPAAKAAPRKAIKRKSSPSARAAKAGAKKTAAKRRPRFQGGTGREETLAQTPETGRTRRGPTNPMPTRRSTGTPAGAGTSKSPRLNRERKQLREIEETVPSPPSSLDLDRGPSAARSGRKHLNDAREDHTETSPVLTGGDVDADWEDAYSVGDEAPGGDNPTPDQDRVDDIGKALGVTYDDNEELKASDKIADRDKHRWELDPASSEDYPDRD
jgi:hypothetical protein